MTTSTEINLPPAWPGIAQAKQILYRLFLSFDGSLRIGLWDGSAVDLGSDAPKWTKTFGQKLGLGSGKNRNRHAISFHYDVSNDFYALWLDKQMIYSCTYYEDSDQSLEQAQRNKLDHICRKLWLKPGGLFLNHGITSDEGSWKKSIATEFIKRYVFPDGQLETVSTVQQAMEAARLEIHDVEGLRQHYALTLREWVNRLEQRREEVLQHVSESVYRVWRLYMVACGLRPAPCSSRKAARGYTRFWRPNANLFPGRFRPRGVISMISLAESGMRLSQSGFYCGTVFMSVWMGCPRTNSTQRSWQPHYGDKESEK